MGELFDQYADGEIDAAQQLPHKDSEQAPDIDFVQARAIDVEESHHRHRQAELVICEAEMLADRFRSRIAPPIDSGRAEHAVVILAPRHLGIAPVDLRGGTEDEPLAVLVRGLQHVLRAIHINVQRFVGIGDVMLDCFVYV